MQAGDAIPHTSSTDLGQAERQCGTHGAYQASGKRFILGAYTKEIWTECPACVVERDERTRQLADREAAERNRAALESMFGQAMIPARFQGRTFETYRIETPEQRKALEVCQAFASDFEANLKSGYSLILSGKPGTGKSHLAAAVLQAIMPRRVGAYLTLMDLIRAVRDTWRRDSERSESQVLRRLTECPLLVIDEIGVQYGTDGERAVLFDVLDRRYREMRPTILMTNLDPNAFKEAVGDRVYDRLREVATWVKFGWESYRTTARKELRDAA